jgi:hypothetical protein
MPSAGTTAAAAAAFFRSIPNLHAAATAEHAQMYLNSAN